MPLINIFFFIDDIYTGIFNTTLTATFFMSDVPTNAAPPSDLIIPISARQSTNSSLYVSSFNVPAQEATNNITDFPRNARRAVFSVSANGQADEEFWWANVPQSDVYTFNATAGWMPGYSPFREVQVLIDGQLAGVQWPFPVIFTGGVSPALHRPIASPDAFDLKEHEIDITPFLPLLCDGKSHTFSIIVAGLDDDGKGNASLTSPVNKYWVVTGKIFIWLDDDPNSITTGSAPNMQIVEPRIEVSRSLITHKNGTNDTLLYKTIVHRTLLISSTVKTQNSSGLVSWSQDLSHAQHGYLSNQGFNQLSDSGTTGKDVAEGFDVSYTTDYVYPLFANTTFNVAPGSGDISIWGHVTQTKHLAVIGRGNVFPSGLEAFNTRQRKFAGSALLTTKSGDAWFFQNKANTYSTGFGDAHQEFRFGGYSTVEAALGQELTAPLYWRNISAVNGSVVWDYKTVSSRVESHDAGGGEAVEPNGGSGGAMGLFGAAVPEVQNEVGGRVRVIDGRVGLRAFMGSMTIDD